MMKKTYLGFHYNYRILELMWRNRNLWIIKALDSQLKNMNTNNWGWTTINKSIKKYKIKDTAYLMSQKVDFDSTLFLWYKLL
jgi:hypothetical protein